MVYCYYDFFLNKPHSLSNQQIDECIRVNLPGAQLPLVSQRFFLRYVDASGVSGGVTGRGALLECAAGEVDGATTCAGEVGRKGA